MSADDDIDPRKLHVNAPRKRRRKKRGKPAPPANIKAAEAEIVARLEQMPLNPGVMLEPNGEGWRATAPHNDEELWTAQMAAAFGTRSISLVQSFAEQLKALCPNDYDFDLGRWKTDEREWNALLAMVADHQPENAAQAALAAQMASVHLMQIRLSKDALNNGGMVMEKSAALASKLARTYAMQCEVMLSLKGKKRTAKQSISVTRESHHHQHIHVHRDGGAEENDAQPQEPRAAAIEGRASLSGPRKINGEVVPFSRCSGEEGLPEARRGESRSAKGQG